MIVQLNPHPTNHPYDYFEEDEDAVPENPYLDEEEELRQMRTMEQIKATPSEFVSWSIYMPKSGGLERFDFGERRYLRAIYDTPAKRRILMAGRQVEKSTLLEGNADHLNGVDWQKGCYLGQELTARVHYRGLLKRRLVPFAVTGNTPSDGTPVMQGDSQIGITRSAADGTALALVEVSALDKPGPFSAGAATLEVIRPSWATF